MHTLSSLQLDLSTTYEYKVGSVNEQGDLFHSPVFEIHTYASNDDEKSFKFIATGDMVYKKVTYLKNANFFANLCKTVCIGCRECSIHARFQRLGQFA